MLIFKQLAFTLLFAAAVAAQTSFSGTLENGSQVKVYVDGTWEYTDGGAARVESSVPLYALTYDPAKWSVDEGASDGPITLTHISGNAFAVFIAEPIPFILESLPEVFLAVAQQAAPDAQNLSAEPTVVGGVDVMQVEMSATVQSMSILYRSLYFGGTQGNARLTTFALAEDFESVAGELDELLAGFEIDDVALHEGETTGTRTIELEGGGTFEVDNAGWNLTTSVPGRHEFRSVDNLSIGIVIEETEVIALEELIDAAVTNAGDGEIVASEEVTINGVAAKRVTMTTIADGSELVMHSVYYVDESGTYQVICVAVPEDFEDSEAAFNLFHAGFTPPSGSE